MKAIITIIFAAFISTVCAQTVDDVLTTGVHIKKDRHILLDVNGADMGYFVNKETTLNDSSLFLVSGPEIKVFMKRLNPLNFSYTTATTYYTDPIDKAADEALNNIITGMQSVIESTKEEIDGNKNFKGRTHTLNEKGVFCQELLDEIDMLKELLNDDKKDEILSLFKKLKALSINKASASTDILLIKKGIEEIDAHFKGADEQLKSLNGKIDKLKGDAYPCFVDNPTANIFIFGQIINDLKMVKNNQHNRYSNLHKAYKLVDSVMNLETTRFPYKEGDYVEVASVKIDKNKIAHYNVTIYKSGFELSENNEIVATVPSQVAKRNLLFRRHHAFVPEVLASTAYTFIEHKKYGTTADAAGKQYVTDAGMEEIRNFNVSAMINWVLYIPSSQIHPFLQLGLGANTSFPTLLTGAGIRFNFNGNAIKSLSISGGITALAWYRTLSTLKVGDAVNGTADIEKDYKYEFAFPPKPYIGLQFGL